MKEASKHLMQIVITSQELPELPQAKDLGDILMDLSAAHLGIFYFCPDCTTSTSVSPHWSQPSK